MAVGLSDSQQRSCWDGRVQLYRHLLDGRFSHQSLPQIGLISIGLFLITFIVTPIETGATLQPRAPNFQYFERPKYRYPYYDENGRGKLLYGYGGPDLYQYKSYSPLEGIH